MSSKKFTLLEDPFSILSPNKSQSPSAPVNLLATSTIDAVRAAISEIYEGFILTKTQNSGSFGIYKAAIQSLTSGDTKYIAAIVFNDTHSPLGTMCPIEDLKWVSFQTRTTTNPRVEFSGFPLKEQQYAIKRSNSILWDKIKLATENDNKFIYIPDHLPLTVEILKLKESDTFANEGTVISAIELYQTVLILEQQY
jgi:hypothetical protein